MTDEKFVKELDNDFKDRWNMLPMYYGIHHDFKLFVYFMIADYFRVHMKIPHIKLFRYIFRSGLKEAKEAVEWMESAGYLPSFRPEDGKIDDYLASRAHDYIAAFELYKPEEHAEFMIELAKGLLMSNWIDDDMHIGYRSGGYEWLIKNMFPEDWKDD